MPTDIYRRWWVFGVYNVDVGRRSSVVSVCYFSRAPHSSTTLRPTFHFNEPAANQLDYSQFIPIKFTRDSVLIPWHAGATRVVETRSSDRCHRFTSCCCCCYCCCCCTWRAESANASYRSGNVRYSDDQFWMGDYDVYLSRIFDRSIDPFKARLVRAIHVRFISHFKRPSFFFFLLLLLLLLFLFFLLTLVVVNFGRHWRRGVSYRRHQPWNRSGLHFSPAIVARRNSCHRLASSIICNSVRCSINQSVNQSIKNEPVVAHNQMNGHQRVVNQRIISDAEADPFKMKWDDGCNIIEEQSTMNRNNQRCHWFLKHAEIRWANEDDALICGCDPIKPETTGDQFAYRGRRGRVRGRGKPEKELNEDREREKKNWCCWHWCWHRYILRWSGDWPFANVSPSWCAIHHAPHLRIY